ncbi:MAG: hypothetical protein EON56_06310, partial [Alphaproteobacteria bacterium]
MNTFTSTRGCRTRAVTALAFALAVVGMSFASSSSAQSPIRCGSVTSGTNRATLVTDPYKPVSFQNRTMANDNAEWITPNLKVAFESTFMLSVMCFGNAPKQQVMLQVIPSQQYLDELKALNLDVRVYSRFDGPSSEIMVRRDQVSSTIGRAVPLEGVRSVSWTPFAVNAEYPFKDGENKNTVSPELTLTLEYVVADIAKRASGKLPSGRNLLIKVMAAGHESTGLEIRPIESDAHFNVGTCPAPALRVNRAGDAAVAVVDFGNVPLDDLKTYGEA